ncbi:MAG: aconitate hydratase [Acidimicrobiales bacterium]
MTDSFGARSTLSVAGRDHQIYRLDSLDDVFGVARLPYSLKVLLENLLRHEGAPSVDADDVAALAGWKGAGDREIAFRPARVLMQDFTGVPAVVDLAAMRDAVAALDGGRVDPLLPVDLVIDHSVTVDAFGGRDSFRRNVALEYERNEERYRLLRWAQQAFVNFRVVPPGTGICHQVNLEYLSRVVQLDAEGRAFPDTLVGTDSHTPMVNGLGVLGWGVGGIEAEAALLGQPVSLLTPEVIGVQLTGELPPGTTATDLVLTVTEMLRGRGVVGAFVEFYGPGVAQVTVENRATLGNMSPEYGSTVTIFPIDDETLRYLRFTGRPSSLVDLVEAYAKEQGLWHEPGSPPTYSSTMQLDLSEVEPSIAGPARPQDRVALGRAKAAFRAALPAVLPAGTEEATADGLPRQVEPASPEAASALSFPASDPPSPTPVHTGEAPPGRPPGPAPLAAGRERPRAQVPVTLPDGRSFTLDHGHVVIAAITSCTNTSNPSVMLAAGLLARHAVDRGLDVKPWVKTSLAPGSQVVMEYYERAGLIPALEQLGFNLVGFGCTTCIGNSGPLQPELARAVDEGQLAVASVLSGNRNFEGRINPAVRMNYLMSPPLVVAYALAGTVDIDLREEPLGQGADGTDVYLRDIWPSPADVDATVASAVRSEMFTATYAAVFDGDERWRSLDTPSGDRFVWEDGSTYVRHPPFLDGLTQEPPPRAGDILGARALLSLGDSITTDHISPAGAIARNSPAGLWLQDHGVGPADFNSYGARRGNHEVMIRGTFANGRIRNRLAPGTEGGVTLHLPDGEEMPVYEAAARYRDEGVPLVVLAGKEYGSGSSRDWAAKGTALLGVRAVLAESYERIHRSNLIGMGVLPLQFLAGESAASLGLTGRERFDILAPEEASLSPVVVVRADDKEFRMRLRIDTAMELDYQRHGGILPFVLRSLAG